MPWVIAGDFNETFTAEDKFGGRVNSLLCFNRPGKMGGSGLLVNRVAG